MISKKTKIALLTSGAIGGLLATSIALSSCTFDMTSSSTQGTTNTTPEFYHVILIEKNLLQVIII